LLSAKQIISTLRDANALRPAASAADVGDGADATDTVQGGDAAKDYEKRLVSLVLYKATIQTYAVALNAILDQTLEVGRHIWYWEDVLYSRRIPVLGLKATGPVGLYAYWIQTAPSRIYSWGGSVLKDVRQRRGGDLGLSAGWKKFYGLVKEVVRDKSLADLHRRAVWLSPIARARNDVEEKRKELKRLRDVGSNAIGYLLGEGLSALGESVHRHEVISASTSDAALRKSVALLESVMSVLDVGEEVDQESGVDVESFEDRIRSLTKHADNEFWATTSGLDAENEVAVRLQTILSTSLVQYGTSSKQRLALYGQPSRMTRYWLPIVVVLLSSTTLLRIFVNKRESIITWIREFGATVKSFWENWILEPGRKILGTIRHDEGSEIAIMSKGSLEGDRESLERMVVEFAVDTNSSLTGSKLNDAQILDIRTKIREGDLTPVLKAYEKDLQRPVMGAIRGNLIRALLIQIQKTKVDVEVAMGGIDSLLKSQELVFG
jgi:nuclear control of ATPase protein 2